MKMSEESYKRFTSMYNYVIENATDEDVEIILATIAETAKRMAKLQKKGKLN